MAHSAYDAAESAMATGTPSHEIPRRIQLTVDVPARLDSRAINEAINITASRLRFALGQHYKRRVATRVADRTSARDHAAAIGA